MILPISPIVLVIYEHASVIAMLKHKHAYANYLINNPALQFATLCVVTICYCDPGINDPEYLLQAFGENGSKLKEWHG